MLTFADVMSSLLQVPQFIFVVGGIIAIIAIVFGTISSMVVNVARERTKRELAAFVAEGSIDADKAIALAKAGRSNDD